MQPLTVLWSSLNFLHRSGVQTRSEAELMRTSAEYALRRVGQSDPDHR